MSQRRTKQYSGDELGRPAIYLALAAFGLALVALIFG
jgi:hypothetical protein